MLTVSDTAPVEALSAERLRAIADGLADTLGWLEEVREALRAQALGEGGAGRISEPGIARAAVALLSAQGSGRAIEERAREPLELLREALENANG